MRIKITLYWHGPDEDVDLGSGYVDALPPPGSLIALSTTLLPHAVWKVVTVYVHPAMPGSMSERSNGPVGIYMLLVEPAEGPFHAAPAVSEEER